MTVVGYEKVNTYKFITDSVTKAVKEANHVGKGLMNILAKLNSR
jgi:hypothetical protein